MDSADKKLRSDSVGWQKEEVDYCNNEQNKLGFTITAEQSTLVMEAVCSIPEEDWTDAVSEGGISDSTNRILLWNKEAEGKAGSKTRVNEEQVDLFSNY